MAASYDTSLTDVPQSDAQTYAVGAKARNAKGEMRVFDGDEWVPYEPTAEERARLFLKERIDAMPPMPRNVQDAYTRALTATRGIPGPLLGATNAATFGLADDVAAGLKAGSRMLAGDDFGESFREEKGRTDEILNEWRERAPTASFLTEMASGGLSGHMLASAGQKALTALPGVQGRMMTGGGGGAGALEGTLARFFGAGEAAPTIAQQTGRQSAAGGAQGLVGAYGEGIDPAVGGGVGLAISAATGLPAGVVGTRPGLPSGIASESRATAAPSALAGNQLIPTGTAVARTDSGGDALTRFPITDGEALMRSSRGVDPSILREEASARAGVLGPDAESRMANFELLRDDYALDQAGLGATEPRVGVLSPGEAGRDVSGALKGQADSLRQAKTEAYGRLREYQPFVERDALYDMVEQTRRELLGPPTEPGFQSIVTPESLARSPQVNSAFQNLTDIMERLRPVDGPALTGPQGAMKFGTAEIETLRQDIAGLASETTNPQQRMRLNDAKRKLDQLYDEAFESGAIQSSRGDPIEFQSALKEARAANRDYMDLEAGTVRSARGRDATSPVTSLLQGIEKGTVSEAAPIARIVKSNGLPTEQGGQLLRELDVKAPSASQPARMGIASNLFGNTVEILEDGTARILDRRAFLTRMERAVNSAPEFYASVFGQPWVDRTRALVSEAAPSRVNAGTSLNRKNMENVSGSGDQLARHVTSGLQMTGDPASAGAGAILRGALSLGPRRRARQAADRVMSGVLRETEQYRDKVDPDTLAAWQQAIRGSTLAGARSRAERD